MTMPNHPLIRTGSSWDERRVDSSAAAFLLQSKGWECLGFDL